MILTDKQAQSTACGRKTTHRVLPTSATKLKPGRRIPIRAAGSVVCHVELGHPADQFLRDLTRGEAQAEGFDGVRGPINWRRAWVQRADSAWFKTHDQSDDGLTDEQIAERFNERHVGRLVVVLTWHVCEAPDIHLAHPVAGKSGDYTTSACRSFDELPVQPPSVVYVKTANERDEAKRSSDDLTQARVKANSPRALKRAERGRSLGKAA